MVDKKVDQRLNEFLENFEANKEQSEIIESLDEMNKDDSGQYFIYIFIYKYVVAFIQNYFVTQ